MGFFGCGGQSTTTFVARELGEDEDWLTHLALGMDREDGPIWVFSFQHEDGVIAFTAYGVENLITLIADHRQYRK